MPNYPDGISPFIREAVTDINKVGLIKMKRYCQQFHPNLNFDRNLLLVRHIAKYGYAETGYRFNISRQAAHSALVAFHKIAKEIYIQNQIGVMSNGRE